MKNLQLQQSKLFSVRRSTFAVRPSVLKAAMILASILLTLFVSREGGAALTATANHDHISIDFFYHGSSVSVRGTADPDTDLIVKVASPEEHQALRRKGRVAGFLWMNVETLTFEKTPNLYFLHSTKKIGEILNPGEMNANGIGYPALELHAEVSHVNGESEKAQWFHEFVKYKESQKLYAESTGTINVTEENGKRNYYVLMEWPYQARPENYTITVYAVKGGKVVEKAETHVSVEQVGVVKSLAGMAKNNGALYGILSVMAALAAGFGVGLVFRKGGGAH